MQRRFTHPCISRPTSPCSAPARLRWLASTATLLTASAAPPAASAAPPSGHTACAAPERRSALPTRAAWRAAWAPQLPCIAPLSTDDCGLSAGLPRMPASGAADAPCIPALKRAAVQFSKMPKYAPALSRPPCIHLYFFGMLFQHIRRFGCTTSIPSVPFTLPPSLHCRLPPALTTSSAPLAFLPP